MSEKTAPAAETFHRALLICGIVAAVCYVATDIGGSLLYAGYSYRDQAVSELFAIGAPTSGIVASLFTASSLLLCAFAVGIWLSSGGNRLLRWIATMFVCSALVGLAIWNLFPMHQRGDEKNFTDTMHLILATNPFVLLSIVLCLVAFRGWFRLYTAATILVLLLTAVIAFMFAPEIKANQPTPGLGLSERVAQYAFEAWQIVLATVLLRERS